MFGIIANLSNKENIEYIKNIEEVLKNLGKSCITANVYKDKFDNFAYSLPKADYIIVLGGDGTVLQAVQNSLVLDAPIIPINTGSLGFLAENNIEDISHILKSIVNKKYSLSSRSLIEVYKDNNLLETCLNDVIIAREGFSRIVSLEVYSDDTLINTYRGDGVIFSTATGSTGYNLSVNGPILSPKCDNYIITPIANHSLFSRSIILSKDDTINVKILESRKSQDIEAILTCDGRRNKSLRTKDELLIKMSDKKVNFIKVSNKNFFEICKEKLYC